MEALTTSNTSVFEPDTSKSLEQLQIFYQPRRRAEFDIFSFILRLIVLILGQGNWFVVIVYNKCPNLQRPLNFLAASLASIGVVMAVTEVPISIVEISFIYSFPNERIMCPVLVWIRTFGYVFCVCMIGLIAAVRLSLVLRAKSVQVKWRQARCGVSLAAFLSIVLASLFTSIEESAAMTLCLNLPSSTRKSSVAWIWKVTMVISCAIFALLLACYLAIFCIIKQRHQKISQTSKSTFHMLKLEMLPLRHGAVITGCFIIFSLIPFLLPALPVSLFWDEQGMKVRNMVGLIDALVSVQYALNPVVYFLAVKSQRAEVITFIKRSIFMTTQVSPSQTYSLTRTGQELTTPCVSKPQPRENACYMSTQRF